MDYILSILQGIIQGLTEFLPVSSSGHLNIFQHLFGMDEGNLFFNVMLHVGTLVAVCAYYRKLIFRLIKEFFAIIRDIFTGKFRFRNMSDDRNLVIMLIIGLIPLLLLFVPIGGGNKVKDIADWLTGSSYFIVTGISLIVTSILLLAGIMMSKRTDRLVNSGRMKEKTRYTVFDALFVGVVQAVAALFPGLSRSGSTLAAGQSRGINKQRALDYTFVLAIPSILAAAVLELKDALEVEGALQTISFGPVIIGMIVAAVVGYFSIVLFKWLIKTDKTYVFVIYTAVVGVAVIIISIIEMTTGNHIRVM